MTQAQRLPDQPVLPGGHPTRSIKVSQGLRDLKTEFQVYSNLGRSSTFKSANPSLLVADGYVVVDAVAETMGTALQTALQDLGLVRSAVAGRVVSGRLPIQAIAALDAVPNLHFIRPAYARTNVGLTTTQGDVAMNADVARTTFGVDGAGVLVGVLSDSYDCLGGAGGDAASGDLPAVMMVLNDPMCPGGSDEGRAMLQLVHDVAPGADLAFTTALTGQAGFANGILALANAGADVIADDVQYYAEPMFQDGVIAQAVDTAVDNGVAYFSAAGNQGRNSYASAFRSSGQSVVSPGGDAHDFDPGSGADVFQQVTIPVGASITLVLQWDQPFFSVSGAPGSQNDVDIALTNDPPTLILAASQNANVGRDPFEFLTYTNPGPATTFNLVIEKYTPEGGSDPGLMKYVYFGAMSVQEYDTAGSSLYGHANAAGAEAVGATYYFNTPAFGVTPPLLNAYSSAGGTVILFDTTGSAALENRDKPEIVAPDGGNTTFFGGDIGLDADTFPNFFGTSSSVAHAAGAAALLLDQSPGKAPGEVYAALESTAFDMGAPGFDADSGFGLIQVDAALALGNLAQAGDCNADEFIDAGDISALSLEIFDGDGSLPGDAPGGTFAGDVTGCDPNGDAVIDAGDLSCTVLLIFEGPGACSLP